MIPTGKRSWYPTEWSIRRLRPSPGWAEEDAVPTRKLEGQLTRLGRTMHDIAYDPIHDEIVVGSPFAQAILVFRGGADGQEAPLRIIQGPRTQIVSTGNGWIGWASIR